MGAAEDPVDRAADEIYGLTLEQFTDRRNELARSLRERGDKEAADAVKGLRKPNQTAWALNQVARRRHQDVERLLEAGAELGRAQEAVMSGDDPKALAAATEGERRVVADLVDAASAIAAEGGVGATESLRERVRSSLQAAARDDAIGRDLRAGRLVGDHQAVGLLSPFTAEAGSGKTAAATPSRRKRESVNDGDVKRVREAKERLAAARRRRAPAAKRLENAQRVAREARNCAEQTLAAAESAEKQEQAARASVEEVDAEVAKLEDAARRLEQSRGLG